MLFRQADHLYISEIKEVLIVASNSLSSESNSPSTPYDFNLKTRPACQTFSNALEMWWKTPLTSAVGLLSKAVCISCIIDSNWALHESPGRKPEWEGVKSLLVRKWLNKEL